MRYVENARITILERNLGSFYIVRNNVIVSLVRKKFELMLKVSEILDLIQTVLK